MKRVLICLALSLAVFSLSFIFNLPHVQSQGPGQAAAGSECKDWSYYGPNGPNYWPKKFPADCAKNHQSPVDIINSTPLSKPGISFDYKASALAVNREHYAVQVNYDPGSSISFEGATYDLKQFHFHLPGEHKISSRSYVMEMHLVHKTPDLTKTAVIGVLFKEEGADNPALKPIVDNLPPPGSEHGGTGPEINAEKLLPGNRAYYKYSGSLTTPCCTEDVLWLVLAEPVRISRGQLQKFEYSQEHKHNNRPVQRRIRTT